MNKKLLNSFVEHYCPRKQCNERLTRSSETIGGVLHRIYFECENCDCSWNKFTVSYHSSRAHHYLDYERLNQLKDYFNEQKTAE
jgi:hypothetical protein